jgi:hypothetical protein
MGRACAQWIDFCGGSMQKNDDGKIANDNYKTNSHAKQYGQVNVS